MRITLSLNKSATALMAGAAKVRVKAVEGQLMIKPTDRTAGGLPKNEKMLTLTRKNASTVKFGLRGQLDGLFAAPAAGAKIGLTPAKHGWFTLQTVGDLFDDSAAIRISAG